MTALKSALGATALVLCFGVGAALAAQTNPDGSTGQTTTGAAAAAPAPAASGGATPADGNTNTANPSASVVQECEAKAQQQGLAADAKGAFLTECEKTPAKKQ